VVLVGGVLEENCGGSGEGGVAGGVVGDELAGLQKRTDGGGGGEGLEGLGAGFGDGVEGVEALLECRAVDDGLEFEDGQLVGDGDGGDVEGWVGEVGDDGGEVRAWGRLIGLDVEAEGLGWRVGGGVGDRVL